MRIHVRRWVTRSPEVHMGSNRALASLLMGLCTVMSAESPRVHLTLQEALKTALDQNPRVHQSILALAASSEDRRMAASALLPQVSAEAFGQRNKYNMDAMLGMREPGNPTMVGPYTWGQARLQAQATLFDLNTYQRWKASRHAEDSARAQTRVVREEVAALVVGQYLRALRADASVKASQSRVELAKALEKLAEDQQKHGIGTRLDTLRAQVRLQVERQWLIQAQTQAITSRAGLVKLLNLEPQTELELTDTLANPAIPSQAFQAAFDAGLQKRPEIQALDARAKAATAMQDAVKGLRYPSLVATGAYGSTVLRPENWADTYQLTLAVKVPLFTGGLISSRVAKAKVELDEVKEARREVQSQVGLEVHMAQAEMDAARSEVETANLAVKLAEEALLQARHRFEAGVSNNVELINAQDDLAKANDNQISALYRLNQYRADLAKATGELESLFAR